MKTKRSIYIVTDKSNGYIIANDRTALKKVVSDLGTDKVSGVYRAVPLGITTETVVKIGAYVEPEPEAKRGPKNNKTNANR